MTELSLEEIRSSHRKAIKISIGSLICTFVLAVAAGLTVYFENKSPSVSPFWPSSINLWYEPGSVIIQFPLTLQSLSKKTEPVSNFSLTVSRAESKKTFKHHSYGHSSFYGYYQGAPASPAAVKSNEPTLFIINFSFEDPKNTERIIEIDEKDYYLEFSAKKLISNEIILKKFKLKLTNEKKKNINTLYDRTIKKIREGTLGPWKMELIELEEA